MELLPRVLTMYWKEIQHKPGVNKPVDFLFEHQLLVEEREARKGAPL